MEVSTVLELVKARIGLTAEVRDTYLTAIIEGVINELEDEEGLVLDGASPNHLMFVVDFATWRYENRGQMGATPEHLRYRRRKLFFKSHSGGGANDL